MSNISSSVMRSFERLEDLFLIEAKEQSGKFLYASTTTRSDPIKHVLHPNFKGPADAYKNVEDFKKLRKYFKDFSKFLKGLGIESKFDGKYDKEFGAFSLHIKIPASEALEAILKQVVRKMEGNYFGVYCGKGENEYSPKILAEEWAIQKFLKIFHETDEEISKTFGAFGKFSPEEIGDIRNRATKSASALLGPLLLSLER